jgi:hypothetical protein
MIIEFVLDIVKDLIFAVFDFVQFPAFPETLQTGIDTMVSLVFDNAGLITLFVRWQTVCIGIPLLILIINFEKVYDGIMWIIRKIPFLGMQ